MDEPLLPSWKRPGLQFNPPLFQIPEEAPVEDAVATPSSLKERIIFGSPVFNPKSDFVWLEYGSPAADQALQNDDQRAGSPPIDIIKPGTLRKPSQGDITSFDDSFLDNLIMGSSYRTWQSMSPDLTRFDLDARSELPKSVPAASRQLDAGPLDDTTESHELHHAAKKHLHRSRTAPAMAVMADKSKSDFVVYKLKQMGRIEEKDILEVCRQFNRLDSENSGKITLSCLINLHQSSALKDR